MNVGMVAHMHYQHCGGEDGMILGLAGSQCSQWGSSRFTETSYYKKIKWRVNDEAI